MPSPTDRCAACGCEHYTHGYSMAVRTEYRGDLNIPVLVLCHTFVEPKQQHANAK